MNRVNNRLFLTLVLFISVPAFALTTPQQVLVLQSYAADQKGNTVKSIEKISVALNGSPDDYFLNLRLGYLFGLLKKTKDSIDHYSKAEKAQPSSVEPLLALTSIYESLSDFANTAAYSEKLLKNDPSSHYGLQKFLAAQIQLKNFKLAKPRAEQATRLYPTDLIFLEQKGLIEKKLGEHKEAKETLGFLLLLSPKNAYALSVLNTLK